MALSRLAGFCIVYLCSADGAQKFNSRFEEIGSWVAHEGTMLASAAGRFQDRRIYATGGNDNTVGIWDLTEFSRQQDEIPPISNGMFGFP